jgi:hypothetical protein
LWDVVQDLKRLIYNSKLRNYLSLPNSKIFFILYDDATLSSKKTLFFFIITTFPLYTNQIDFSMRGFFSDDRYVPTYILCHTLLTMAIVGFGDSGLSFYSIPLRTPKYFRCDFLFIRCEPLLRQYEYESNLDWL